MLLFISVTLYLASLVSVGQAAPTAISGTGEATYYDPGLGSCGRQSTSSDMIVAVSAQVFDGFPGAGPNPNMNPICGKWLIASYAGKNIRVTVVDKCPGCARNDLDLSPAAFERLAPLPVGRLRDVRWSIE